MEKTLYAGYAGNVEEYLQKAAAGEDGADRPEIAAAGLESVRAGLARLRAVRVYLDLLPGLYAGDFYGENAQELKVRLEEASLLMPDNYLLLTELGRLYAWLEQSDKAGRVLNDSIRINPDFAQSYSRRGALLLLLRKHSLALADLDRAVSLSGGKAEYYYERAIILRAMGDQGAMCENLRASCLAGNCSAHEWAVAAGECD
jgi:tetratricopeptide (TPR) repeat protein